jgi:very-short-patch-repair endonuclease
MICKECNKEFETIDGLRRHRVQKHNKSAEETYTDYILNGNKPTCKCGCGEHVKFLTIQKGFVDYVLGHSSRVNNNWGHNPDAIKKSHQTQKKMYNSGELRIWNKGLTMDDERVRDNITKIMLNPERGNNISKKLSGVPKSAEHIEKIKETSKIRWSSDVEREKQSQRLITSLIKNNYRNKKTKLELLFQQILTDLKFVEGVDYVYQHQLSSAIFDFYFFNKKILIEVDGDFHHCNPDSIHKIPTYPIQIKTVGNDIRKNLIAKDNNYKLLRFWETDIKNNPEYIIKKLKEELFNN